MDDGHGDIILGDGPEWIGLGEAARRLGVTRAAIYGRIERRTLVARPKGNRGVEVQWPPPQRHPDGKGDIAVTVTGDVMVTTLDDLRERLERAEGEAERLRDQNAQLYQQIADLHSERDRIVERSAQTRERAAKAEGEATTLRDALADLSGRLDRAEARLAMPWWRRLIG